ncbi:histidine kinase [Sphingomonas sp. HITSZ_GF]|uniref:sensor histidine kinase n=1 Tax=Sphingomonas sp. HITSZ_GF TaxID=3037247 RepID=UPI00240E5C34|nr:histidine kinase [Sphingomonas sp. HITSZ_GF]MDG2534223.1 histidine kinase [Sphingomonas sp. HITSZ_GF]
MRPRDVWIAAGLTIFLWLVALVLWSAQDIVSGGPFPTAYKILLAQTLFCGLLLSAVLVGIIWLCRRAPRRLRVPLIMVAALTISIAHGGLDAFQVRDYAIAVAGKSPPVGEIFYRGLMPFVFIYGFYATAWGLTLSDMAMRETQRRLAEANEAAHQAQLAALRFQLNPHFLFNTLNAISSLIVTQRNAEAEHVTMKLADFLRLSLETDPQEEITLDEELANAQSYLDIESARFGERLHVEFDCPAALLDAMVPSFLLQPLVENAIKYAVAPSRARVKLALQARETGGMLELVVQDDGRHALGAKPGGLGVGLANVRKRLSAFYGELGEIDARATERGFRVRLTLPLRTVPVRKAAE